jgi:hypothetical protein
MTTRPVRIIRANLTKKGFAESVDGDHIYLWLTIDGKDTGIKTKISHSATECGDSLLSMMARQVKLARKEFEQLVDCTLGKEGYLKILRNNGILSPDSSLPKKIQLPLIAKHAWQSNERKLG